jgi:hypothetical protein
MTYGSITRRTARPNARKLLPCCVSATPPRSKRSAACDRRDDGDLGTVGDGSFEALGVAHAVVADEEIHVLAHFPLLGEDAVAKARMGLAERGQGVTKRGKRAGYGHGFLALRELPKRAGNQESDCH